MQVACRRASRHCGVVVKLLAACVVKLKVGGSIPFLSILLPWMFFHYTLQLHGILQYFLLQEMACIDPPNQKTRNAKVSTFWRFPPNAKNSCREPCLLPASTKFEILGTTLLHTVVNSLQTKQHKTNQKPMQSRRFQAIFEVNLWTEHSVCPGKIY